VGDAKSHQRVNDILLGPLERPALQWLAEHMPPWMTPDLLSAIGVLGALLTFAGYALTGVASGFLWLASAGLVVNWFGDSLDGTLARYRRIERPKYGFFVDHTVDALSEAIVVLGLGLSPLVRFDLACLALIGYLLMSVLVYVRTVVDGVFRLSYGKFGPTEVRAILILVNTGVFFFGNPLILTRGDISLTVFDVVVAFLAAALVVVFVVSTWQKARELAAEGEGVDAAV
jgi:phosphatidylglycerophosphate synthase